VAPGESVAVITERLYGRATDERMREILAMNGIADPRKIAPGTILVCPAPPPVVAPSVAPNIEPDVEPDIEPGADPGADPGPDLTPAPQSSSSGQP